MQNFFLNLLKFNGLLLILMSFVIIFQIWFEPIDDNGTFTKIWWSYVIIIVNFLILSTTYKHFDNIEKVNSSKKSDE